MAPLFNVSRRIIFFSLLTILLTGALVGISASWPMYKSVRAHIEQTNLTNAQAKASAIGSHLDRYHSLAAQFTSRTEIRKRLEAYLDGQLSLEQLRQYSQPRLAEPTSHIPDLLAMVRTSADQQLVAATGPLAERLASWPVNQQRQEVVSLEQPQLELIKVSAPILNPQQQQIGTDSLFFDAQTLQPLLGNFSTYEQQAQLGLLNHKAGFALLFDQHDQQIHKRQIPEQASVLIEQLQDQPVLAEQDDEVLILVPLPDYDCILLVSIPSDVFYQAAYQDAVWAYLSVLLMLLLGSLLSHHTVRPLIYRLTSQAEKINRNALELRLAANVFEQTTQAIVITDNQLNILRANRGALKVLDMPGANLEGCNLKEFLVEQVCDNYLLQDSNASNLLGHSNSWQGEVCYKKQQAPDGEFIPTLQNISGVEDENGNLTHLIHIFTDITERKAAQSKILYMAHHDALTGMPNRSALMERLHTCVENKEAFAVLFIDLDKFKPVNDTHGHQAGDLLLKQVAQRIRACVRINDTVGRLGGDEFLMIIESARDSQRAQFIAEKIIKSVAQPYQLDDGIQASIGVSVGIAFYPKDADNSDQLVQRADAAMYQAKQSGGNRFAVYQVPPVPHR